MGVGKQTQVYSLKGWAISPASLSLFMAQAIITVLPPLLFRNLEANFCWFQICQSPSNLHLGLYMCLLGNFWHQRDKALALKYTSTGIVLKIHPMKNMKFGCTHAEHWLFPWLQSFPMHQVTFPPCIWNSFKLYPRGGGLKLGESLLLTSDHLTNRLFQFLV